MSNPSTFRPVFMKFTFPEPDARRETGIDIYNFRGTQENAELITEGFVSFFYFHPGDPSGIRAEQHEITGSRQSVTVPQATDGAINTVYYLYSRIRLTGARLDDICGEIRSGRLTGSFAGRAVRIPTEGLLGPGPRVPDNNYSAETAGDGSVTAYIYLYDWYGYLEQYTDIYSRELVTEGAYREWRDHLAGETSLLAPHLPAGTPPPASEKVTVGELYAAASPALRFAAAARYRDAFRRDGSGTVLKRFHNKTAGELRRIRGGRRFTNTRNMISSLFAIDGANSAFIDYLCSDSEADKRDILELAGRCLDHYLDMLTEEEREEVPIAKHDFEAREDLANWLEGQDGAASPRDIHARLTGGASFFVFLASLAGLPEALVEAGRLVLGFLLEKAKKDDRSLLNLHALLTRGILMRHSDMSVALTSAGGGTDGARMTGPVGPTIRTAHGLELEVTPVDGPGMRGRQVKIRLLARAEGALATLGNLFALHNILVEMALMREVPRFRDKIPSLLSITGSAAAIAQTQARSRALSAWLGTFCSALVSAEVLIREIMPAAARGHVTDAAVMHTLSFSFHIMAATLSLGGHAVILGAAALSSIGALFGTAGGYLREDDIKLALRHGIWGKSFPRPQDGDMPSWWPVANSTADAEIVLSDIPDEKIKDVNALKIYAENDPAKTLSNSARVLAVATQILPLTLRMSPDVFFVDRQYLKHRVVEMQGLGDYSLVEQIQLKIEMDNIVLHERIFSHDEADFLARLVDGGGNPASGIEDAKEFRCALYGGLDDFRAAMGHGIDTEMLPPGCIEVRGLNPFKRTTVEFAIKFFDGTGLMLTRKRERLF